MLNAFEIKDSLLMAKHKVLSTKKLEPSLIEQAKENDIEIIEQEFISIQPILNQETLDKIVSLVNQGIHTIAFTSANAVDALNSYMHIGNSYFSTKWNVFCLSGKTRQAVSNALLLNKKIAAEASNATELASRIIKLGVKEIIFFCGNKRRDELPAALKNAGVKVHEVILYETTETPVVVENDFDAVLFFSPSGVQSYFTSNELDENKVCFAIGRTTATSIATFTNNKIIISKSPNQEMLLASVLSHFKNNNCHE